MNEHAYDQAIAALVVRHFAAECRKSSLLPRETRCSPSESGQTRKESGENGILLGSLFNHLAEQQSAQVPAGLQQQILQIASMPTIQTTPVISTPVPIQPKPMPKAIAPATMNPSMVSHKQPYQSKVSQTSVPDHRKNASRR